MGNFNWELFSFRVLWYVSAGLWILLLLKIFLPKIKIKKTIKVICLLSPVFLIAVAYAMYTGVDLVVNYWEPNSINSLLYLFATNGFFYDSNPISLPVEISIIMLLTFVYVYLKLNRNFLKAVFKVIPFYFLLHLFISKIWVLSINIPTPDCCHFNISTFLEAPQYLVIDRLLWITVFLLALQHFSSRYKIKDFLKNIRWERLFLFLLFFMMGFGIYYFQNIRVIYLFDIVVGFVPVIFYWVFAIHLNDYFDRKIDAVSNPNRPMVKGIVSEKHSLVIIYASLLLHIISMVALYQKTPIIIYMMLFYLFLCVAYCVKPLYLRRYWWSIFIVVIIDTYFFWLGYYFYGNIYVGKTMVPTLVMKIYFLIVMFSLAVFNIKDLKDVEGDKRENVKNLFTIFGEEKGKKILGSLILFISTAAPFMLSFPRMFVNSIIFGGSCYLLLTRYKKIKEVHIFVVGFIFILSLMVMEYLGFNLFKIWN